MTFSIIFSGASLILCGFFFVYFTLYIKRRTERANILGDYQDEVNKLIADIDSATDRDALLVEDRITALKKLLEDVDKRITVLTREQDRKGRSDAVYSSLGRQMKVIVQEPPAGAGLPAAGLGRASPLESVLLDREEAGPPSESVTGAADEPVAAFVRGNAVPAAAIAEKQELSFAERAAELSRAGFSPDLIAARLGKSISEVELAIAVSHRTG
ncbi:hypothetical protein FACS189479_09390 [Spirochaetia bacterium]|nr:hypothetical protein FACS189479_09390 [Spirochaetia bacterium]